MLVIWVFFTDITETLICASWGEICYCFKGIVHAKIPNFSNAVTINGYKKQVKVAMHYIPILMKFLYVEQHKI